MPTPFAVVRVRVAKRWLRLWRRFRPRRGPSARQVTEICRRAARGDLEARIVGANPNSEFGRMCKAINDVLDVSDAFVREAAAAMDNCSRDRFHRPILLRGLHGDYRHSAVVINSAGLKMQRSADNFFFVQKQAAENSGNVHRVAAACEELSAATQEISGQTDQAAQAAEKAVLGIKDAASAVEALSSAVAKVQRVVEVINDVAMQTNLLALNASIEAAHAGEKGQGFAVVASEVKALSSSTHQATEEIAAEVKHLQDTIEQVRAAMTGIQSTVSGVHDITASISMSAAQQVEATSEISNTIMEVSKNSEEVSLRIVQSRA